MSEDSVQQAVQWCSQLTGLPKECFEGLSLQDKLDFIAKWYASAVIADQVTLLLIAMAFEEDGVTHNDIAKYFGTTEARRTPLGRLNFVAGISSVPRWVKRAVMPLLKAGAYRPHICVDVGAAIGKLLSHPSWSASSGPITPANVVDAIYSRGLSPYQAKKIIRSIEAFLESHPDAVPGLLQSLVEARQEAVDLIAGIPDVGDKMADLEGQIGHSQDQDGIGEARSQDDHGEVGG